MDCATCDDSCGKYHQVANLLRKRDEARVARLEQQGHWIKGGLDQSYVTFRRWTWEDPADFFDRMGLLCAKYLSGAKTYSREAQAALARVRPILANGLVGDMKANPGKSGDELQMTWLRTHPAVYAQQGIFNLSVGEQARIYAAAGIDLLLRPTMAASAAGGGTVSAWKHYVKGKSVNSTMPEPYRFATRVLGFDRRAK